MKCSKCGKKLKENEENYFYIDGFFRKNQCEDCYRKYVEKEPDWEHERKG